MKEVNTRRVYRIKGDDYLFCAKCGTFLNKTGICDIEIVRSQHKIYYDSRGFYRKRIKKKKDDRELHYHCCKCNVKLGITDKQIESIVKKNYI